MRKVFTDTSESFYSLFRRIYIRLPKRRKIQFWFFCVGMVFVAVLEAAATGAAGLFASALSAPDRILDSKYIIGIRSFLRIDLLNSIPGIIASFSLLVMFLIGIKNGMQAFMNYTGTRFAYLVDAFFGEKLFSGILNMPYEWHLSKNSADNILVVQWRSFVGSDFLNSSLQILSDILIVLFLVFGLILVQPLISMILIITLGGTASFIYMKVRIIQVTAADYCRACEQGINRDVTKAVHGIKDVKVSGQLSSFVQQFRAHAYRLSKFRAMRRFIRMVPVNILEVAGFVMFTGAVFYMLFFLEYSTARVSGTITVLAVATWRILPATNRIVSGLSAIRDILPYSQQVLQYMAKIERNQSEVSSKDITFIEGLDCVQVIKFENVFFMYKGAKDYAINDMSFQINEGQTVGVIGPSGAGKSTFADLLMGLLTPTEGKCLINGCELDRLECDIWMRRVGYVPQSPYIFDGTLAENVAFGLDNSQIDRGLVLDCCKMAYMEDFLADLPEGIDTSIGERGVRLSGGQQQRVAIARALYFRSEVIVFDEATSSLDTRSEKAIQETIQKLKGHETLIIIAHRLSTVKDCDTLFWIEKGKIKMVDTPENVLQEYEKS